MLCELFNVASSCYYEFKQRKPDANRIRLASQIEELFNMSRGSAGSRTVVSMLSAEGIKAGRFKVRQIMREAGLMSKQPGSKWTYFADALWAGLYPISPIPN